MFVPLYKKLKPIGTMEKYMKLEDAIRLALADAKEKNMRGLLRPSMEESVDEDNDETLYSLCSMYSQFVEDEDAEDKILDALVAQYPDHE